MHVSFDAVGRYCYRNNRVEALGSKKKEKNEMSNEICAATFTPVIIKPFGPIRITKGSSIIAISIISKSIDWRCEGKTIKLLRSAIENCKQIR